MERKKRITWGVSVGFWTLATVFFVVQSYTFHVLRHISGPFRWRQSLKTEALYFLMWMVATPLVVELTERFKLEKPNLAGKILSHAAFGAVTAVCIHTISVAASLPPQFQNTEIFSHILGGVVLSAHGGWIMYWMIVGLTCLAHYHAKFQAERIQAARLETQLSRAQLRALKMQLHPHFLFNALNSISALQLIDPNQAHDMTARLGDFLRMTLRASNESEVPLKREIEFLTCYLEIEQMRFRDRMTVEFDIDPDTRDLYVPNLILQPIVENAVRYAVSPCRTPTLIQIRTRLSDGRLLLEVRDDGPGLADQASPAGDGVGLSNTRNRLRWLYGDRQALSLTNAPEGGLTVTIELPAVRHSTSPTSNESEHSAMLSRVA